MQMPVSKVDASWFAKNFLMVEYRLLNFEYNDRRNKIIPKEVQAAELKLLS